jgi:hypothetical protein
MGSAQATFSIIVAGTLYAIWFDFVIEKLKISKKTLPFRIVFHLVALLIPLGPYTERIDL